MMLLVMVLNCQSRLVVVDLQREVLQSLCPQVLLVLNFHRVLAQNCRSLKALCVPNLVQIGLLNCQRASVVMLALNWQSRWDLLAPSCQKVGLVR
jgi:hypothetical protein